MDLDWKCVRAVLQALKDRPTLGSVVEPQTLFEWPADIVSWHMLKLRDAGFIEAACHVQVGRAPHCVALDLTIEGSELLAKLRAPGVLNEVCKEAQRRGLDLTFDVVKALASTFFQSLLKGGV